MLVLVFAIHAGCGTAGNFMGAGHGGPRKPMGGVLLDGYFAYKGVRDGKPQGIIFLFDVPFSFAGDILTLPITLTTTSDKPLFPVRHKVFYKNFEAERITIFRVERRKQSDRKVFHNRVKTLLERIVRRYNVREIKLIPEHHQKNYIYQGTSIVIDPLPNEHRVLEIAVLNEFKEVNIYEELISRLEHSFRRAFEDRFYLVDDRRAEE